MREYNSSQARGRVDTFGLPSHACRVLLVNPRSTEHRRVRARACCSWCCCDARSSCSRALHFAVLPLALLFPSSSNFRSFPPSHLTIHSTFLLSRWLILFAFLPSLSIRFSPLLSFLPNSVFLLLLYRFIFLLSREARTPFYSLHPAPLKT